MLPEPPIAASARGRMFPGVPLAPLTRTPPMPEPLYSPHTVYETELGETCTSIAERLGVDPFGIVFLNMGRIKALTATAVLRKSTKLMIPAPMSATSYGARPSPVSSPCEYHSLRSLRFI